MKSLQELIKWIEENKLENEYNNYVYKYFGKRELSYAEILISLQGFYNYQNILSGDKQVIDNYIKLLYNKNRDIKHIVYIKTLSKLIVDKSNCKIEIDKALEKIKKEYGLEDFEQR